MPLCRSELARRLPLALPMHIRERIRMMIPPELDSVVKAAS